MLLCLTKDTTMFAGVRRRHGQGYVSGIRPGVLVSLGCSSRCALVLITLVVLCVLFLVTNCLRTFVRCRRRSDCGAWTDGLRGDNCGAAVIAGDEPAAAWEPLSEGGPHPRHELRWTVICCAASDGLRFCAWVRSPDGLRAPNPALLFERGRPRYVLVMGAVMRCQPMGHGGRHSSRYDTGGQAPDPSSSFLSKNAHAARPAPYWGRTDSGLSYPSGVAPGLDAPPMVWR